MDDRKRFVETMTFGSPDRIPFWECAYWWETLVRWAKEGLPDSVMHPDGPDSFPTQDSTREFFGFDKSYGVYLRMTIGINMGMLPGFDYEVVSEDDEVKTVIEQDGAVVRISKINETRQYLKFPVETYEDFKRIKKRFDPDNPARFPEGWEKKALALQEQGAPICINAGGYYGFARGFMGMENLSYAFYDQPKLIEEMFELRTHYMSKLLEKALAKIKPDCAEFWEDMACKSGSLVSPKLYRKLALKHYRTITDILRKHGVNIIILDSDGNVDELIPIWLDGGINCVWPFEAASGMDPVAARKKYGKNLGIIGGIDKRAMIRGKAEVKDEVMSKVPYLIETGGYIPTCDHAVPPDVPFENYMYYLKLIREIAGC